jgi:chemotaxis protein CheD
MTDVDWDSKRVNLVQGEYKVSADPKVIFSTLLGSCVGACIRDPIARVGGMNHFLLPGAGVGSSSTESERVGVHLMELLVNGLMRHGAQRDRLEAKIFGGARMMQGLSDIGKKNADFAKRFLSYEGIRIVGGDLGGERGRRLQFWPVTGRALQSYIAAAEAAPALMTPSSARYVAGEVDLF